MAIVALASLASLIYAYVGYPVLIGALARIRPLRVGRDPAYAPSLSVCIPVFNVAGHIGAKLDSVLAQDVGGCQLEVLVVSDGSTDGTDEVVAARAARDPRIRVLRSDTRQGKPSALNRMREEARGELLVLTDARQPLDPGAIRALVDRMADPAVGCVSGNLVLAGEAGSGVYWRYENWIRRQEAGFRSMFGVTGPLYAVRRADLPPVPPDIILDDVFVPMTLRLRGRTILLAEDAVARDQAFADEREFGRKARTLAGNYQIFARMPALLVPLLNPSWFETFSHKLLRLLCPWLLLALLASTAWVAFAAPPEAEEARWFFLALAGGQGLFYALALLGDAAGRLGSVARTFVVLNAAAVVGLWRFVRGRQKVTW